MNEKGRDNPQKYNWESGGWGGGTGMFVLPQNLQIQIMMMTDAAADDDE